jgi:hypothetical protein
MWMHRDLALLMEGRCAVCIEGLSALFLIKHHAIKTCGIVKAQPHAVSFLMSFLVEDWKRTLVFHSLAAAHPNKCKVPLPHSSPRLASRAESESRCWWVISLTPWLLYHWGKNPFTCWVGGWVGPRTVLATVEVGEICALTENRIPIPWSFRT